MDIGMFAAVYEGPKIVATLLRQLYVFVFSVDGGYKGGNWGEQNAARLFFKKP